MKDKGKKARNPLATGVIGSIALFSVYFGILAVANSPAHAIDQFMSMWYWVLILAAGFGIQIGLYTHIKNSMCERAISEKTTAVTAEIAATGGISTGSMIACCAHHITDVLPILGLSAASVFLTRYQTPFLILGVFSNIFGLTMMLTTIQKHNLFQKDSALAGFFGFFKYDMKLLRNAVAAVAVMAVSFAFIFAFINTTTAANPEKNTSNDGAQNAANDGAQAVGSAGNVDSGLNSFALPSKTNNENTVSIEVTPIDFAFEKPVKFDISLNTHQGSLDYDLTKISVLEDDTGNTYQPLNWDGSQPGGHHRYGILTFPKLNAGNDASKMKLIIKGVYDVPERTFSWDLKHDDLKVN